MGITLKEL